MIELIWDTTFKKSYKKRIADNISLKKKFWKALELFVEEPFNEKLKTHKLTGKLEGMWALSVSYEYRIVFAFVGNKQKSALLIDIGTHDEVY